MAAVRAEILVKRCARSAFAAALGVTLGALTRRTLAAMLPVLVLFSTVRVCIAVAARPNYSRRSGHSLRER
jgi:hypothetical protein